MAKKQIRIEHTLWWTAEVTFDEDIALPFIKDMVNFWAGSETLLKDCNGDYVLAFSRNLTEYLYRLACEGKSDEYPKFQDQEEGWSQLTPEFGFYDLRMDEVVYDYSDFEIDITLIKQKNG